MLTARQGIGWQRFPLLNREATGNQGGNGMLTLGQAGRNAMLRRSISCMAAGLLLSAGLYLFIFGYFYEWHPGKPMLVLGGTLLIASGIWLYDEVREILRSHQ
jgi:hypothetical protein